MAGAMACEAEKTCMESFPRRPSVPRSGDPWFTRRRWIHDVSQQLVAAAIEDQRILPRSRAERTSKADARQDHESKSKQAEKDLHSDPDNRGTPGCAGVGRVNAITKHREGAGEDDS